MIPVFSPWPGDLFELQTLDAGLHHAFAARQIHQIQLSEALLPRIHLEKHREHLDFLGKMWRKCWVNLCYIYKRWIEEWHSKSGRCRQCRRLNSGNTSSIAQRLWTLDGAEGSVSVTVYLDQYDHWASPVHIALWPLVASRGNRSVQNFGAICFTKSSSERMLSFLLGEQDEKLPRIDHQSTEISTEWIGGPNITGWRGSWPSQWTLHGFWRNADSSWFRPVLSSGLLSGQVKKLRFNQQQQQEWRFTKKA